MILDQIVASTTKRVAALKETTTLALLKSQAKRSETPFAFEKALARKSAAGEIAFICEVKKASPSKGVIAPDFPYLKIARDYQLPEPMPFQC
jgi:Indole-3-glycerol phosphate synthase